MYSVLIWTFIPFARQQWRERSRREEEKKQHTHTHKTNFYSNFDMRARWRHLHMRISLFGLLARSRFCSLCTNFNFVLISHSTVEPMNVIANNFSHNKNVVVGNLSAFRLSFAHTRTLSLPLLPVLTGVSNIRAVCVLLVAYILIHTPHSTAHKHRGIRWIVVCTCENVLCFTFYSL